METCTQNNTITNLHLLQGTHTVMYIYSKGMQCTLLFRHLCSHYPLSDLSLLFFPQTITHVPEESTRPLNPRLAGKLSPGVGFMLIYSMLLHRWRRSLSITLNTWKILVWRVLRAFTFNTHNLNLASFALWFLFSHLAFLLLPCLFFSPRFSVFLPLLPSGSAARPPQKAHDGSKDSERQGVEEEESVSDCFGSCGVTGHTGHRSIL